MGDTQIQVLAKATVLGTSIDAGFYKNKEENLIVVYGKADPSAEPMSLTDLVEQCKNMVAFFKEEDKPEDQILEALPDEAKKDDVLGKIQFRLKEVYFVKSLSQKAGNVESAGKSSEFAFWFEILLSDLTKGWPIELQNFSIKLWRTTNPKILEEMKISEMEKLLTFAKGADKGALPEKK